MLSVAGSEAAVERSFSAQGTVHSDRRNRLTDKMVEAEMYIRFNRLALRRAAGEVKNSSEKTAEIIDDDDPDNVDDEAASSVADLFKRIAVEHDEQPQEQLQQQEQQEQQQERHDEQSAQPAVVRSLPRARPSTDHVERFIAEYVRTRNITARFKWRDHHEQQLQAAAVNYVPPMLDTVMDLKKKIMLYVRGMDVVESVAAAAAAEDVIVPS